MWRQYGKKLSITKFSHGQSGVVHRCCQKDAKFTDGLVPLFLLRWRVNILTLGDEEAKTMGVNAKRLRTIVILCATLITAASVSVSGMIGWVGLVIPHLTRRVVGNNYKYLMPASMLFGAIFLLLVDDVSRNLFATEIPIGILTSLIGAPFFIYLMSKDGDQL